MRGLSARDLALWDILAQAANLPLYRVLGAARERIRIYNTCGGPTFYPELVTESVVIQDGHILAPTAPGLGTALLPDLARRPDATLVESVPT